MDGYHLHIRSLGAHSGQPLLRRVRILGELIQNPFVVPHDERTVALRLVRHPVPVPAAGT